jgi:tryptophan synthase alpha subunit
MRTTLNLDDDALKQIKAYAESTPLTIGKAASELVRRGLSAPLKTRVVNGLVVVDLPEDSDPVTTERVKRLEAEEW